MEELTARDWNRIIGAVNAQKTPEEAGLCTEEELLHYRTIWTEAEEFFANTENGLFLTLWSWIGKQETVQSDR